MQRLEWKIDHDLSLNAQLDGWAFEIVCAQHNAWQLCIAPIPDRGPDWRNWYLTTHLQDAMALAQAIASGANLS